MSGKVPGPQPPLMPHQAPNLAGVYHNPQMMMAGVAQPTPSYLQYGTAASPMMYPPAPAPTPMAYPQTGCASGSSTPANSRSPSRTRRAQCGVDNTSMWLAQHNPHLAPRAGPGSTYSPAASVMSYQSTTIGAPNTDETTSIMSGMDGGNRLTELQPTQQACQTENVDPATAAALYAQLHSTLDFYNANPDRIDALMRIKQSVREKKVNFAMLPQDLLEKLAYVTVFGICNIEAVKDQTDKQKKRRLCFGIFYDLASCSRAIREFIYKCTLKWNFTEPLICQAINAIIDQNYETRAIFSLCVFLRDGTAEHTQAISRMVKDNYRLFKRTFEIVCLTHTPTIIEFLWRLLSVGNKPVFKDHIRPEHLQYFVCGPDKYEGVLKRYIRKGDVQTLQNIVRVAEIVTRAENPNRPTPKELEIQAASISYNIVGLLLRCFGFNNIQLNDLVLLCMTALARGIPEAHAGPVAIEIASKCLSMPENKSQMKVIYVLLVLSTKRPQVQAQLLHGPTMNYACHLLQHYVKPDVLRKHNAANNDMFDYALEYCHNMIQLHIEHVPEYQEMWNKETVAYFYKPETSVALLNILLHGKIELKILAIKVMLAGLKQPPLNGRSFRSSLFEAFDTEKSENVASALFDSINETSKFLSDQIQPGKVFQHYFSEAIDLLLQLMSDDRMAACIMNKAKQHPDHFPCNLLASPSFKLLDGLYRLDDVNHLAKKVLEVCKRLVCDADIQQLWAVDREKFVEYANQGEFEICGRADEILGKIRSVASDIESYSYEMQFANAFTNSLID